MFPSDRFFPRRVRRTAIRGLRDASSGRPHRSEHPQEPRSASPTDGVQSAHL
jgi:hypothetical protein